MKLPFGMNSAWVDGPLGAPALQPETTSKAPATSAWSPHSSIWPARYTRGFMQSAELLWALLVFCGAETGGGRIPLAHIGALLGVAVVAVAAEVIDLRAEIGPDDRVAGAVALGLRFGGKLPGAGGGAGSRRRRGFGGCARRRRRGLRGLRRALGGGRRAGAALGDEGFLGLAARLDLRLVGRPFGVALLCRPLLRQRRRGEHQRSEEHTSELQSRRDLVC